jgi:hypothetical protein
MGLSFITPMLLGGAALVAVPIVLHLIMRRKPVKHNFPAVRFLRERAVANRRRLRLSHILLLLLRMAALALLALALARPVLRGAGWLADREGPVAAAFVFDTAPRMMLREANRTRLDQARGMAKVLFDKLPPTSKVAVLDTGGGAAAFSPTVAAAAARIEKLAAATPSQPLTSAIGEGLRLLEGSELTRREIYVFTDCSHGGWDGAAPLDLAKTHPETSVLFVDVGCAAPQNFAIDSIDLSSDQLPAGTALAITAATSRSGPEATRSLAVELLAADGHYARRAVKPLAWKPGGGQQVDFEIAGLEPGLRQGRVIIEGSDDLEADNVRSFTVEVGSPARVIVAAPAPASRTGLFMTQAIAPLGLRKAGKARFDAKLIDVATLDATPWEDARGIVLVDPPPLPPRIWEMLEQWVSAGRGLIVWLGPRAGEPERFNSEASRRVLGGGIVRVWRSPDRDNYLAPAALDHPILAAFRRVGDAVPWQDFPVGRHWEFQAEEQAGRGDAAADGDDAASVVATYRNGLPAVLEHRLGQGDVVIVTTPVSQEAGDPDAWNTLATGFEPWPFVMLANEMLLHAIDTADDRNVVAGSPAVLHLDRRDIAAAFVRTPSGDDFPAAVDQKRGTITVTATQIPGNYVVRAGGDVGGVAKGFSANLAAAATDYSRVPPEALAAVFGEGHRIARTESELVRDVNLERIGAELFGWIILLAAAVMAADWIVANRFYAPRDNATAGPRPAVAFVESIAAAGPAAGVPPIPPPVPPPIPPGPPPVPMQEVGS